MTRKNSFGRVSPCDSLNAPSRRTATRLGFAEEGTFFASEGYQRASLSEAFATLEA